MLVALVVAHENVLAMHTAVIMPPTLRLLDGLSLGVIVSGVGDVVLVKITEHLFLPFGDNEIVVHNDI
jgi:hypothetical protein